MNEVVNDLTTVRYSTGNLAIAAHLLHTSALSSVTSAEGLQSMSREDMYSDIVLPPQFYRDGSASVPELRSYVAACIDFLTSPMVSSILECHPNDVAVQGPDPKWDSWWKWAAAGGSKWTLLIPGWHPNITTVPKSLKEMLDTVDSFTLPRKTEFATHGNEPTLRGMSPKKSHEVLRMSNFIQQVLRESPTEIRHVVDVGAGQVSQ